MEPLVAMTVPKRAMLIEVGKQLQNVKTRLPLAHLFFVCERVSPASIFRGCELIFDLWFCECGPQSLHNKLWPLIQSQQSLSPATIDSVLQQTSSSFCFYLLKAVADVDSRFNRQLYYLSLFVDWKGFSSIGMSLLANGGVTCNTYYYNKFRSEELKKVQAQNELYLHQTEYPISMWIDNHSKCFGKAWLALSTDVVAEHNFTAVGLSVLPKNFLHAVNLRRSGSNTTIAINSKRCLTDNTFVDWLANTMTDVMAQPAKKYNTSLCTKLNITTVPITSKTKEQIEEDEELGVQSVNGLENFYGVGIEPHNIGSTDGFVNMLVWLLNNTSPDRYTLVRADVNIYMRYYRVCMTTIFFAFFILVIFFILIIFFYSHHFFVIIFHVTCFLFLLFP